MEGEQVAIGIDLGTTFSCVGIYKNEKAEVVLNNDGDMTTPSMLSFEKGEPRVGQAAMKLAQKKPENTVYCAKRFIGKKFRDEKLQADLELIPFKMKEDANGNPLILLNKMEGGKKGTQIEMRPQDVSSHVLKFMKQQAEAMVEGRTLTKAVITVPAYFTEQQRQATMEAATLAGLEPLKIINEPTAAAFAFGVNQQFTQESNIMVFDLGGGTTDVTILVMKEAEFVVKTSQGNTHLGGEDFNKCLMDYFIEEMKTSLGDDHVEQTIKKNERALRKLRTDAERLKKVLTYQYEDLYEYNFADDDQTITVTRQKFQDLCKQLFQDAIDLIKLALDKANLNKEQIDQVVLVGGSTRIPKIQEMIKQFFDGKELNTTTVDPDHAVALGATWECARLMGMTGGCDVAITDIVNQNYGIMVAGGKMFPLIQNGANLPAKGKKQFLTTSDDQAFFDIKIYEGTADLCKDCTLIGKLFISNLRDAPKGQVKMDVEFIINDNGVLSVKAEERDRNDGMDAAADQVSVSLQNID